MNAKQEITSEKRRPGRPPRLIEDREKSMEEGEKVMKKCLEEGDMEKYRKVQEK
jgi:hypothetical protein